MHTCRLRFPKHGKSRTVWEVYKTSPPPNFGQGVVAKNHWPQTPMRISGIDLVQNKRSWLHGVIKIIIIIVAFIIIIVGILHTVRQHQQPDKTTLVGGKKLGEYEHFCVVF